MVLKAADELRHSHLVNTDPHWRESVYFNFNDPLNGIGGWIYLWVVPNQEKPAGMLVSLYHGHWPDLQINDKAMQSPGHIVRSGSNWLYCFKRDSEEQLKADFDDVELFGLELRRIEPLERYSIAFEDEHGSGFELNCRFMMPPYDYADGAHPTPPWMALNRYHRSWWVDGRINVAGQEFIVNATGDSDHSWGQRHTVEFAKNNFKMWSFQSADGRLSVSVLGQQVGDREIPLGFVALDGRVAPATAVEHSAAYDDHGVQHGIRLNVADQLGRSIRAEMPQMHSYLGSGSRDRFWGFEGVGPYHVQGFGAVNGLSSYFWPARVSPEQLRGQ